MTGQALAQLLDPAYREGLAELDLAEVRVRRTSCQRVEGALSYLRRLVQGRHDIVRAELDRRASGGAMDDLHELVDRLPEILASKSPGGSSGRLSDVTDVADVENEAGAATVLFEELERVGGIDRLGALAHVDELNVRRMADDLADLEAVVSARRRQLHRQIDALNDEVVRRYKSGEATVDALLTGE